jgi:YfiH family protein
MISHNYSLIWNNIMDIKLANWPAPTHVKALCTTRISGVSLSPYGTNNLGLHVGDLEAHVLKNRQQVAERLGMSNEPLWLNQTHSTQCIVAEHAESRNADASVTRSPNHPLVILTADCLPIALCNNEGTEIAAIHAGWRGLFHGIVENTINKLHSKPMNLMAWIGPAICQKCYEVGQEVYEAFTSKYPLSKSAFTAVQGKWLADLPSIAEIVLNSQGINSVYKSDLCTFELKNEFYSYRREQQTGRMGTFIWLTNNHGIK